MDKNYNADLPPSLKLLVFGEDGGIAEVIRGTLGRSGVQVAQEAHIAQATGKIAARHPKDNLHNAMPDIGDQIKLIESLYAQGSLKSVVLIALNSTSEGGIGSTDQRDTRLTSPLSAEPIAQSDDMIHRIIGAARETVLRTGSLVLDLVARTAIRDDRRITLLPKEFHLLEYLMRYRNQVVSRGMLLKDVWRYRFVPKTNLVDVHIGKLRRKIDGPNEPAMLQSIRSVGYMLRDA